MSKDKVWVEQRSHEAYAKNYAMVFPHDEALAGRNRKKDPLHEVLLEAGDQSEHSKYSDQLEQICCNDNEC